MSGPDTVAIRRNSASSHGRERASSIAKSQRDDRELGDVDVSLGASVKFSRIDWPEESPPWGNPIPTRIKYFSWTFEHPKWRAKYLRALTVTRGSP